MTALSQRVRCARLTSYPLRIMPTVENIFYIYACCLERVHQCPVGHLSEVSYGAKVHMLPLDKISSREFLLRQWFSGWCPCCSVIDGNCSIFMVLYVGQMASYLASFLLRPPSHQLISPIQPTVTNLWKSRLNVGCRLIHIWRYRQPSYHGCPSSWDRLQNLGAAG